MPINENIVELARNADLNGDDGSLRHYAIVAARMMGDMDQVPRPLTADPVKAVADVTEWAKSYVWGS